jgi:hypothetical protein
MDEDRRRVYRSLAFAFLVIGGVFALVSVAESLFAIGFLRGNALPVALFLIFIGAALMWTVRDRPGE